VIGVLLLGVSSAAAQTNVFVQISGGGTQTPGMAGGAVAGGTLLRVGPVFAEMNAFDVTFKAHSTYPFGYETIAGVQYCMDVTADRVVGDSRCVPEFSSRYALSGGAGVVLSALPFPLLLGVGHRFDEGTGTWYGSAGAMWTVSGGDTVSVRVNIGPSYVAGLFGVGIALVR
jgi:hypothetical protein